jgi:hypothetical protein
VSNPGTLDSLNNLALAVPAGFELVANTCASTLGPGSSCTAGVEFAPTAAGAQAGNLTVTSSTVTGATTVPLSGMGFDFTVAASGSNSETVAGGQTASYTLTICGVGGCSQNPFLVSQGTFTFECATLPEYALCLFNPASETVSAGAQGSLTVEISTGQASSSSRSTGPARWRLLPLTCGLVLLPLGWKRRRKALLFAVLLAILAGGVSSCASSGGGTGGCNGGGSCGSGGSDTTPTGTYSIPVTVTSTGVQHTVTLTLTVD